MNPETSHWHEVESIFDAAVDLDDEARRVLLDARCGTNARLRSDVELLLASDARAGELVEPTSSAMDTFPDPAPSVGSIVGTFRLVEEIGTGGMGTVYRAQRDDGFAQQVAIKIIATPASHAVAARRFRAERQILASLQHPHIVTLLDGGITTGGYAYLVMEYVDGTPITQYCAEQALTLVNRLQLFRLVCSAVQYAHRHSVVHRDLKPANVIVTAEGVPKVLDFGVAKLLDRSAPSATTTGIGLAPLTPNYASPEQLRGLPLTSSSDVYALGVMLYELVSGERPYETEGKPLDEMIRLVVDTDPPRPSAVSASRTRLPYERARALRGDVDAIVLRAMAKRPEERYSSAEELADDINRFTQGVPVVAREPSLGYLARKMATRHRVAFFTAATSLVLVIAALVAAVWQAQVARAQRERAEARFTEVRQLANSLIFEIHDTVAPLPGSTPVRHALISKALAYLEKLAAEAGDDQTLLLELSSAYSRVGTVQGSGSEANLGETEDAIASFRRGQALVAPLIGHASPPFPVVKRFVEATLGLSQALNWRKDGQQDAIREAERAVAAADAYHQRQRTDVEGRNLLARAVFSLALATRLPAWLPHWQRAGALYEGLLAEQPDNPQNLRNVALVEKYLGAHYESTGDAAAALQHFGRARTMDEKRLALKPDNRVAQLDVAIDLANEGNVYLTNGDPRAADLYEKSLAMRQAIATSDPKDVWAQTRVGYVHGRLARVYERAGQRGRALEHGRRARSVYAAQPRDLATNMEFTEILWMLARLENATGERARACDAYAQSFRAFDNLSDDIQRRLAGDLPEAARNAVACGVSAAQSWLGGIKTPAVSR
jgi:serine/threonine protein kinase